MGDACLFGPVRERGRNAYDGAIKSLMVKVLLSMVWGFWSIVDTILSYYHSNNVSFVCDYAAAQVCVCWGREVG